MIDPGDFDDSIGIVRTGDTLRIKDKDRTIATFKKEEDGEWELVPDWEEGQLTEQQELARAQARTQAKERQARLKQAQQFHEVRKAVEEGWSKKPEESVGYMTAQECFKKAADLLSECNDVSCSGELAAEHRHRADAWRELGQAIFALEQANAEAIRDLTRQIPTTAIGPPAPLDPGFIPKYRGY